MHFCDRSFRARPCRAGSGASHRLGRAAGLGRTGRATALPPPVTRLPPGRTPRMPAGRCARQGQKSNRTGETRAQRGGAGRSGARGAGRIFRPVARGAGRRSALPSAPAHPGVRRTSDRQRQRVPPTKPAGTTKTRTRGHGHAPLARRPAPILGPRCH